MRRGAQGPDVADLQRQLVRWGYPLRVDGDYGARTEAAVWAFQAAEGLDVDGIAGKRTTTALWAGPDPEPSQPHLSVSAVAGVPALAIAAALGDLGAAESPPGSNRGPAIGHLVDGYCEHWHIPPGPASLPWCAMAVSVWTAMALGLGGRGDTIDWSRHPFLRWFGRVEDIRRWGHRTGRLCSPCPGAIYYMARDGSGSDTGPIEAGHCGIVEDVQGSTIVGLDGNVSNRVKRVRRPSHTVRGAVRWW